MSQLIIPAIALGGVYLIYEGLTKKKKSKHHSSSSSSSSGSSSSSSSGSSSSSSRKHKSPSSSSLHKRIKVKNVTKKKREKPSKPLYIFYTTGGVKNKSWRYTSLPSGWVVKRKGDTNSYTTKYTKVVVFNGPKKNREEMKKYANKVFEYLKKKNIIKNFKISSDDRV